jgi:alkanesulfonate monooxygenase SsuD/methylene tetrahydromethanopterin reductase-like flavin-dependent oxidoreductase (luciferase family)
MKFSYFGAVPYIAPEVARGWPVAPRHFDRSFGPSSMEQATVLFELAHELGFDALTVAEHHYATRQITPAPIVTAAALGMRIPTARINVLGAPLPLLNPVRVAEELAYLDNLLEGRLDVGLFRGSPNEYMTYGTNPRESKAMFNEGVELLLRAWAEPEPFAWEGVHYRFRLVSLWPQPFQQPRPRIFVSASSPESAAFAARHHLDAAFSFMPLSVVSELVAIYREHAAEAGWEPTADNVLYRANAYVAETDEQAAEESVAHSWGSPVGIAAPAAPRDAASVGEVMGRIAREGFSEQMAAIFGAGGPPGAPPLPGVLGSPATVIRQVAAAEEAGIGRLDLVFNGDTLPVELGTRSLRLFGEEVIPAVQRRTSSVPVSA